MSDQNQGDVGTGLDVSDADLFSSAVANDAPASDTGGAVEQQQQLPLTDGGQPRDERGRFATKEQQQPTQQDAPPAPPPPAPQAQQQQPPADGAPRPDDQGGNVPSWRLREEREAREAAMRRAEQAERDMLSARQRLDQFEREMRQRQQPQQPVDPLVDPAGFISMMREERERERLQDRLEFSMERAHEKHGKAFEEAYLAFIDAAPRNQMWAQSVLRRPNPGQEIVNWHRMERMAAEVGSDPAAYKAKVLEEALKDPQYLAKAVAAAQSQANGQNGTRPQNVTQMPVSLSRVPGAGPRPTDDNDMSDAALFRHATAR